MCVMLLDRAQVAAIGENGWGGLCCRCRGAGEDEEDGGEKRSREVGAPHGPGRSSSVPSLGCPFEKKEKEDESSSARSEKKGEEDES